MPRRSKTDALATREALLDAAQVEFLARGVSHTSLAQVAATAGCTRGAVYWHFKDKNELFSAMMARAQLPLEMSWRDAAGGDARHQLQDTVVQALRRFLTDRRLREVFLIATQKVEYVGEQEVIRERQLQARDEFMARIEALLARMHQDRPLCMAPAPSAMALHSMIHGLIYNWGLAPQTFHLAEVGEAALDAFLDGLCAPAKAHPPPGG